MRRSVFIVRVLHGQAGDESGALLAVVEHPASGTRVVCTDRAALLACLLADPPPKRNRPDPA